METDKRKLIYEGEKLLRSLLGTLIYAVGINMFVVPTKLYTSGLLGICQLIRTVLVDYLHMHFDYFDIAGIIYYLINIPILFFAMNRMGKGFLFRTLWTVTAMTMFLAIIPIVPVVEDTLTACVVGGLITGVGVGITLCTGSSLGGIDVIGVIITQCKKDFSVGRMNLFLNLILYGVCMFLFQMETVVYSFIFAAVYSIAIDKVHIQNINVEVHVITKADTQLLEKEVFKEIGRGITKWDSMGAYTNEQSHVLYILLSKYEVGRLKAIVHKYDHAAFLVVNEGVKVDGNYLKKL